jgi:hypothetical protein
MLEEMPYTELQKWIEYFKSRPSGYREDYRTFLLMKAMGYKGKGEDLFQTLRAIRQSEEKHKQSGSALPTGKFLNKMLAAKGGDGSGWKPDWI